MTSRTVPSIDDPRLLLQSSGRLADEDVDLATTALALAALIRPDASLAFYCQHLQMLADDVARSVAAEMPAGEIGLAAQIRALNDVLFERHGYEGDRTHYDDLQNADLMRVIDRRRGLPIALGILYIHAARAQGWLIEGVNFPGHFLLRLRDGAAAAIVDPFNGGRVCDTSDLRELVKAVEGETAELRQSHFQPAGNRQMLLRLQNNIKLRLLRDEKVADAAAVLDRMLLVAPDEPGLWHEAGALQGRLGNLRAAVSAFENLVALSRNSEHHGTARRLLAEMRARLN